MTLDSLKTALLSVCRSVSHFEAMRKVAPYIVYAEEGDDGTTSADNEVATRIRGATVDLFTASLDGDALPGQIEAALTAAGFSWRLESVQFEEARRWLHYEWYVLIFDE